jgi:AmmeMemoRadiSam system protein B
MQYTRQPAVAGAFYPGNREVLASDVNALLKLAQTEVSDNRKHGDKLSSKAPPKALIVPHAGYIYSGPTAAAAYARLSSVSDRIKRVILLGPVHRVPIRGLALPGADVFATPLGQIQIDSDAVAAIKNLPQVIESTAAHEQEHSLEVQLPFLQMALTDFTLLPLAVGDATAEEVAEVLDALWGGPETLIVISSDLSHFLPYQTAQLVDGQTTQSILHLQSTLNHQQACGGTPVNGLMLAAKRHHLQPQLLDLRNSGDTAGDKDRVVGYASFAFTEEQTNAN